MPLTLGSDATFTSLPLGELLAGTPYRLVRLVGRGAMSEVYEAVHEHLGTRRALKVLSPAYAPDSEGAERLQAEGRALAKLRHPKVVEVLDLGVAAGRWFLVMPLLEGETLRSFVAREGRPEPERACAIVAAILDGLQAAHDLGFVHRDVKPDNTFLCVDGGVKVLDFGIAKALFESSRTQSGMSFGTPRYMSPEQAQGATVSPRTDVYSAGVLLYELLTGSPPFEGESSAALAYAHAFSPVPALVPRDGAPGTARVVSAVRRALHKSPAARFGSAADLAAELRRAIAEGFGPGVEPAVRPVSDRFRQATTRTGVQEALSARAPEPEPPRESPATLPPRSSAQDRLAGIRARLAAPPDPPEPLARGTVLHAFREAVEERWGRDALARLAAVLPAETRSATLDAFLLPISWYPVRYILDWQEAVLAELARGDDAAFCAFIDRTLDIGFGRIRRIFLTMTSPTDFLAQCGTLWRDQHTHGELTAFDVTATGCRGRLADHPFTTTPLGRRAVAEVLRHALVLAGLPQVRESHELEAPGVLALRYDWGP